MIRQGFRVRASMTPQENMHPYLRFFFPLGDVINEPFVIGGAAGTAPAGTVIDGPRGKAREFSASSQVALLYTPANNSITMLNFPWTAMFFINLGLSNTNVQLIYGSGTGSRIVVNGSAIQVFSGGTTVASASVSLSPNTWYHIAISVGSASGTWMMYLNGSPLTLGTNGNVANWGYSGSGATPITIYLVGTLTNGPVRLDQWKVYNKQLSDAEIVSEMNKKYF